MIQHSNVSLYTTYVFSSTGLNTNFFTSNMDKSLVKNEFPRFSGNYLILKFKDRICDFPGNDC